MIIGGGPAGLGDAIRRSRVLRREFRDPVQVRFAIEEKKA
jgi:hypothetical protein